MNILKYEWFNCNNKEIELDYNFNKECKISLCELRNNIRRDVL